MLLQPRFRLVTLWLSGFALAAAVDPLHAQGTSVPLISELSGRNAFALIAVALLLVSAVIPGVVHVMRRALRGRRAFLREIDEGKKQLDRAISNMSQGLLMFDSSHRLVLCNQRYMEIYGVSPKVMKPGLHFRDLLQHRKDMGSYAGDVDLYCREIEAKLAEGKRTSL